MQKNEAMKPKESIVVCGSQESKTDSVEENENSPFNRIFLGRNGIKQLGMGLLVNKSLKVASTNLVNERISTLTVTKKDKIKSKSTPTGMKLFKIKKKQCELSITTVHNPHMGITSSQEKCSLADDFYDDFRKTTRAFLYLELTWLESLSGKNVRSF